MERMTEKQVAKNTIEKLAIVVVTYRRQQLLATLFESIEKLTVAPWRIIVVDNEHSEATQGMTTGVFAQYEVCFFSPYGLRSHDFIRFRIAHHAMLMNTRLMSKGVRTHDWFIWRNYNPC